MNKKIILSGFLLALASTTALTMPVQAELFGFGKNKEAPAPKGAPQSFADLSAKLLPTVVNISSTQKAAPTEAMPEMPEVPQGSPFEDFFKDYMEKRGEQMQAVPTASLGSGFIIDAEKGLIVTNNHVIRDADEVRVTLHDDTTLDAEIIGKDEKTDLAVLKVKPGKKLVAVPFGNSDAMRVGDWVVAIGNPFGLGGTVTAGIISARQRDINAGPYDDFIQTDASINRGNSGGPMFNLKGEVIGINTAIYSPSGGSVGIGFAIPANLAKPTIDQLIKYGKTKRGWIGVRIQSVTDEIAENLGLDDTHGALVASVTPDGPAAKAGLKPGDIITKLNGQAVSAMKKLPRIVAETPIGSEAELTYTRDGKTMSTKITIGELEKAETDGLVPNDSDEAPEKATGTDVPEMGMVLDNLSPSLRETYELPDTIKGVLVTEVSELGEAAEKGLMVGDVILEVNQAPVTEAAQVKAAIAAAKKAAKSSILLLVDNQGKGDVRFVALRIKDQKAAPVKKEKPSEKNVLDDDNEADKTAQ